MNKKGQFFLIAAIIISLIVITLGAVYITNVSPRSSETQIYDLSNEIKVESNQVIDNGVFNARNVQQTNSYINQLIANYSATNPDTDLIVIYGNSNELYLVNYTAQETGSVGIPGSSMLTKIKYGGMPVKIQPTGNKITLKLTNISYDFNITEGQNFYVVLKKKIKGEQIVSIE